jgi:hypothetical protein
MVARTYAPNVGLPARVNACRDRGCQAVRYADAISVERFASYMALSAR